MDIKNFYLVKEIYDLEALKREPEEYIGGFNNNFLVEFIEKNRNKYVENGILLLEGSVIFSSNNKEIGQIPLFDDLPTIYSYYLNAIEEYMEHGVANFYYPSQPIEVRIEKQNARQAKINIDEDSLVVNEQIFLESFINNSQNFFGILANQLKLKNYQHELAQIENIKKRLVK